MLRVLFPFFDPEVQDWAIAARMLRWLTFLWLFVGLVVLFSASYAPEGLAFFGRQLAWLELGLIGFGLLARSPLRRLFKLAPGILFVLLGLILATKFTPLGTTVNGASRWVALGPLLLQPSELIKPVLVLQSAWIFGRWQSLSWGERLLWLAVFALVLGGILMQPNLSTAALCGMSLWLIALAGGLPLAQLGTVAMLGIATATVSISTHEYQLARVTSFLNPWADARGNGYQLIQSLLAIGSGGAWGSGLGLSQQKLAYLPFQYTDFIFAIYAEEFGFVGSVVLLVFLIGYATLAVAVAMKSRQAVHQLVAMGATIFLIGQSLIHIGVATGVLPTTGLPLPFFSYGGNSILSSLCLAGLLVRVARESNEAEVVSLSKRRN